MSHFLGAVALGVALITPVAVSAQGHQGSPYAYYDAKHRDWHEWNADEDKAYHQYLSETHKADQDFSKSSDKEQQEYWKWRHKHMQSK